MDMEITLSAEHVYNTKEHHCHHKWQRNEFPLMHHESAEQLIWPNLFVVKRGKKKKRKKVRAPNLAVSREEFETVWFHLISFFSVTVWS